MIFERLVYGKVKDLNLSVDLALEQCLSGTFKANAREEKTF